MDKLVRKDNVVGNSSAEGKQFDIRHYKKWLVRIVPNIHLTSFEINLIRFNRYIMPFSMLKDPGSRIGWWDALITT
jgi:hypothetical protein